MLYVNGTSLSNYLHGVAGFSCTLNRDDSSVCRCGCAHVYGVCRLGSCNVADTLLYCLLTPPQYVRTISHIALFKGGDGDTRGEERTRVCKRFRYPLTTLSIRN